MSTLTSPYAAPPFPSSPDSVRSSRWPRLADALSLGLVAGVTIYSCLFAAVRDFRFLIADAYDDAAYYFEIAQNIVGGRGSTFDGLHATNGYQPLWEGVLVGLQALVHPAPEGMLRLVLTLQSLMLAVTGWLVWRALRRALGSLEALLGVVLFVGFVYFPALTGMESALTLLVAALILDHASRWPTLAPPSSREGATQGVLLGLLLLCRLDSAFAVGCFVLLAVLPAEPAPRRNVPATVLLAGIPLLTLAAYLLTNLASFGHPLPISGMLKSSFPRPGWYYGSFPLTGHERLLLIACTVAALAFLGVQRVPARSRSTLERATVALALGLLAHHAFALSFMKWAAFPWHYVLSYLALCLLAPFILHRAVATRPAARAAAALALCALALLDTAWRTYRHDWNRDLEGSWQVASYEAARWANAHLPATAILAMKDAGNFAYFSRRRVVNLDGVVNGFAYQDAIRDQRVNAFLRDAGVRYVVQHAFWDDVSVVHGAYETLRLPTYSHLYEVRGDPLVVSRAAEVYRSAPYDDGPHRTVLVIWRFGGSGS